MFCLSELVCRCGEAITVKEQVAYGNRCEDCFSTVCLYTYRSAPRYEVSISVYEKAHTRLLRTTRRKPRPARY